MKKKVLAEITACADCPHFDRGTFFCSKLGRRSIPLASIGSSVSVWEEVPEDCPLPEAAE